MTALSTRVLDAVDSAADSATSAALDVLHHPETGFQEHRTAARVATALEQYGYTVETGLAVTGVAATWDSGRPGPTCLVSGELDALVVPDHPDADATTGAAHACGHHAQLGVVLAVAGGFAAAGQLGLVGRIRFIAAPAEETTEIARKLDMRAAGTIEFIGGKQELVRLGALDDVDLAIFCHATGNPGAKRLAATGSMNGHIVKQLRFIGKEAHAGAAPHLGINALKAATIALAAIDAHRETFRESDVVRVHPIVTHGGDAVNVVPGTAVIETYVRAASLEPLLEVNARVDRAAMGAAIAIGCGLEVVNLAGYLPMRTSPVLTEMLDAHATAMVGADNVGREGHLGSTTDVGDVSHVLPTANLWFGGAAGGFHTAEFVLPDLRSAISDAARTIACTVHELLQPDGISFRRVVDDFRPQLTIPDYLRLLRSLSYETTLVERMSSDGGPLKGSRVAGLAEAEVPK